jgi:hypothetical protein
MQIAYNAGSSERASSWMSCYRGVLLMEWIRRLLADWRGMRPAEIRRVVLMVLDGLEPARVDEYLEQGVLHNLALLSDVGTRAKWNDSSPLALDTCAAALAKRGLRTTTLLSPERLPPQDVDSLSAADRDQQERLISELARGRGGLVLSVFDLPARLGRLFGTHPDAGQQQVIRDVYLRMDEIVGKAYSFVDERTTLVVGVRGAGYGEPSTAAPSSGLIFTSFRLDDSAGVGLDVLRHLRAETGEP